MLKNLIESAGKGAEIADKFIDTRGETEERLSERHQLDMSSDNWLAKSIRPMTLLILLILQTFIVVYSTVYSKTVEPSITYQMGILLAAAFGFYFNSRKAEKLATKNANANITLEKIKSKQEFKLEKKQIRASRKASRRAEREQESEGTK